MKAYLFVPGRFTIFLLIKEHALYRVFDSLEYEDEESHRIETGFKASGDLSDEQTKDIMPLSLD